LKEKRMHAGESLQELADEIGMSKAHVYDLETGKSANPSAEVVKKLSDHYKVSVSWWFDEQPGNSDEEQLKVMFRSMQDLNPRDRELIQTIMDKMKSQQPNPPDQEKKDDAD
jgi:transcriptional regulator with XRE-family HTH domain